MEDMGKCLDGNKESLFSKNLKAFSKITLRIYQGFCFIFSFIEFLNFCLALSHSC